MLDFNCSSQTTRAAIIIWHSIWVPKQWHCRAQLKQPSIVRVNLILKEYVWWSETTQFTTQTPLNGILRATMATGMRCENTRLCVREQGLNAMRPGCEHWAGWSRLEEGRKHGEAHWKKCGSRVGAGWGQGGSRVTAGWKHGFLSYGWMKS